PTERRCTSCPCRASPPSLLTLARSVTRSRSRIVGLECAPVLGDDAHCLPGIRRASLRRSLPEAAASPCGSGGSGWSSLTTLLPGHRPPPWDPAMTAPYASGRLRSAHGDATRIG